MLDHRGLLERFSRGTVALPFLNFGMFQLDLRALDCRGDRVRHAGSFLLVLIVAQVLIVSKPWK